MVYFVQGEGAYTSEVVAYLTIGKSVNAFTLRGGNMYSQFGACFGGSFISILCDSVDNIDLREPALGTWASVQPGCAHVERGGYTDGIIEWKYGKKVW